ncbi:MAG: AAA family ATPase [archaeon]
MKIAFIGTHGTGKTTLAHELTSKLKKKGSDVDFLGEIVRKCPFPINENTTKKSQIWIILNQIIKEMETEERCKVLVSDRSVLDGYCYYVNQFGEAKFLEALIKSVGHI